MVATDPQRTDGLRSVPVTTTPHWPAPQAPAPLDATVTVPGSKSVTNRAVLLASLADAPSLLRRPLRSRDTTLMVDGLRAMGTVVEERTGDDGREEWYVMPTVLRGPAQVDVGNAGTVMRFLPPLAALADGPVRFDGDERARQRPIGPLLTALRALGTRIEDTDGAFPLTVLGAGGVSGGPVTLDASSSSQLVSGLLLAGPRFNLGVEVHHEGGPLPSLPHVAMTVAMLREAGAQVEDTDSNRWRVVPGALRGQDSVIEPDLSNAAPFLVAALVCGGQVTVTDWPERTCQPGARLPDLLTAFGGSVRLGPGGLTVTGGNRLTGIDVDLRDCGELAPVLAALAALADSESRLRGIGHLRGHETDRLAALAKEISGLGGDVTETEDGLRIRPRPLHGGVFATYDDHRLVMAAAVLGLAVPGVQVENVATVGKTLPEFTRLWGALLEAGDTR